MEETRPGYYAVIPADVRYDDSIPANAKLLYGEISALIGADGYCFATNQYFSKLYGMAEETIARLITKLEKAGHNQAQKQKNEDPDMSALRESGQIEQDADLIMMLSLADSDKPSGPRKLRVRKNKEGICPSMMLTFDGRHQTFSPAPRTSEVVSKLQADGKRAKARNKLAVQDPGQMTMLPSDTPVPFRE